MEKRLNFWRTVCGCIPGALTLLAALIWRGIVSARAGDWATGMILAELAFIFLAGIGGKVAAVAFARAALFLEIFHLWRRVRASRLAG